MKKSVVFAICFFLLGYFVNHLITSDSSGKTLEHREKRQGGYTFINPLLECENAIDISSKSQNEIKNQIERFIEQEKGEGNINHVSIYFRDLNNGPWFGIKEKEFFAPASLLKVAVMIAYYKEAESDPGTLERKLKISQKDLHINQNIPGEISLQPGKEYSIDDLISRMVYFSDNNAFNVLVNNIGEEKINKVHTDLGINIATVETPNDYISVKTYSTLFRVLYNASYLNRQMSEKALEKLSKTTFTEGIVAGIPENSIVAHKYGVREYPDSNEKQLHDCGIVYASVNPYLLCVMTKGDDLDKLTSSISKISEMIYQYNIK